MNKLLISTCSMLIILPLMLLGAVSGAVGGTLRVPAQFPTITKALEASATGDTINVAAGTYFEHVVLKRGVTLKGGWNKDFSKRDIAANETIIDGIKEKGATVVGADNAVLDGFTVIHATLLDTGESTIGSGVYCFNTSPTLTNNNIKNNEPSGVYISNGGKVKASENRIHDNAQAGIYVQKGSELEAMNNVIWGNKHSGIGSAKEPVSKILARNNTIFNNVRSGINAQLATGRIENNIIYENQRAGINLGAVPMEVANNTVVSNGQAGLSVDNPANFPTIKNNIFSNNVDAGIRTNGKGFSNNLLFANGATGNCNPDYLWCVKTQYSGYGDENSYKSHKGIVADPLFVNAAEHDYHLNGRSPAIDAGDKNKIYNDVNFPSSLGSARNDIGAYGGPHAISEKAKPNNPPQADSGPDHVSSPGKRVILDGRGSSDPDGDVLSYQWQLVSSPKSSKAKLIRADRNRSGCTVDLPGDYTLQLVVTDSRGQASKPSLVKITVPDNLPPIASIGEVISRVSAGDTITLYGSSSKDPEGKPLTYKWSVAFKPEHSHASFANPGNMNSSFMVDVDGGFSVQLIVNDGKLDSEPAVVSITTGNPVKQGVRNVPREYPNIQAAIDAAEPGDSIIVQKGVYKEQLLIDKSVNLKGVDWPVLDGGNLEGNRNTISIFYLGDRAGKVEGFIITGSGRGELGHGINIWDSSPDVFNNRITANIHGIGIHGSPSLTAKTKIHSNLIYKNSVGIGNGKDSEALIYNNRVYDNYIVGIGSRGKAAPRIKGNYVYNNRIGIGAREVASPQVEGNHIFANTDGIVISPLSTIKKFAYKDIVISNNLIVDNDHIGINITSFNLSNIQITNNTIDSNNRAKRRTRGGGVVLGYPQPATFSAVVESNIITNNTLGGVINYIGPENFPSPGATVKNSNNNVWNNTADFLALKPGPGSVSVDPGFSGTNIKIAGAYSTAMSKGYKYNPKTFSELPTELDAP